MKKGEKYSVTINFLRRRLVFDVLRTCLIFLRGYRGQPGMAAIEDIELGQQKLKA